MESSKRVRVLKGKKEALSQFWVFTVTLFQCSNFESLKLLLLIFFFCALLFLYCVYGFPLIVSTHCFHDELLSFTQCFHSENMDFRSSWKDEIFTQFFYEIFTRWWKDSWWKDGIFNQFPSGVLPWWKDGILYHVSSLLKNSTS